MNKRLIEIMEVLSQKTHVDFILVLQNKLTGKREEKKISIELKDFENNWNSIVDPINSEYFVIKIIHADTNTVLESFEKP